MTTTIIITIIHNASLPIPPLMHTNNHHNTTTTTTTFLYYYPAITNRLLPCLFSRQFSLYPCLQIEPLQTSLFSQTFDQTTAETMGNPNYLQDLVQTTQGFIGIWTALSSLTPDDWRAYNRDGILPDTYNPLNDHVWMW